MTNFYDKNGEQIKAGDTLLFESENEIFVDNSKCDNCVFGKLKNNKNCKTCDEFSNFKEL